MSPELFQDAPYSTAVDMFATGVLLFNLLSGTQPFDPSGGLATDEVVQGNIDALNWGFNGEGWTFISTEARELVSSLLVRDPDKRPSACELLSSCRWVQGDAPRWVFRCKQWAARNPY
jgi:serine/threonine protein kinase